MDHSSEWHLRRLELKRECKYCFQEEAVDSSHHTDICPDCIKKYACWRIKILSSLTVEAFLAQFN